MEMNTRLQVEHPVTEEITGIDLVEQQLRIAAGESLAFTQQDIVLRGHSFEARVCCRGSRRPGFLPSGGEVQLVTQPRGDGVRVDTALFSGLEVGIDYDPMLAKIITWGEDREQARRRLVQALESTAVFGFPTNVAFMRALLQLPEVISGALDTGLIDRVQAKLTASEDTTERDFADAALLLTAARQQRTAADPSPWARQNGWRLGAPSTQRLRLRCARRDPRTRSDWRTPGAWRTPLSHPHCRCRTHHHSAHQRNPGVNCS